MPSRPVLIGRGLVTHTHQEPHHTTPTNHTASTIQNLNQQPTNVNGSPRYGGHSGQETPGPIPNPEVKPASANGTAPDRMWESRTPPNILFPMGAICRWPPSLPFGPDPIRSAVLEE